MACINRPNTKPEQMPNEQGNTSADPFSADGTYDEDPDLVDTFTTDTNNLRDLGPESDAAGNLTFDGNQHYTYDAYNRVVMIRNAFKDPGHTPTGGSAGDLQIGSLVAQFSYDGQNRRTTESTYLGGILDNTEDQYYLGWSLIETRNGSDQVTQQHVWNNLAGGYIDSLAQLANNSNPGTDDTCDEDYYAMQDQQFNILALADDTGEIVERYEYTLYGDRTVMNANFTPIGQSTYAMTIGFQGLRHHAATNTIDNRYRLYIPELQRFGQRDPLGYPDGMNSYAAYHVLHGGVDPNGLVVEFTVHDTNQLNTFNAQVNSKPFAALAAVEIMQQTGSSTSAHLVTSAEGGAATSRNWYAIVKSSSIDVAGTSGFVITYDISATASEDHCSCILEGDVDFWAYAIAYDEFEASHGWHTQIEGERGPEVMAGPGGQDWPTGTMDHELWHTDGNENIDMRFMDDLGARQHRPRLFPGYKGGARDVFEAMEAQLRRVEAGIEPIRANAPINDWNDDLCQIVVDIIADRYLDSRANWILEQGLWHVGGSGDGIYKADGPPELDDPFIHPE